MENEKEKKEFVKTLNLKRIIPISLDSNILTEESQRSFLVEKLFNKKSKVSLIFRGSKDGFGIKEFHAKCDGV
jgi:hypothetical protein